MNKRNALKGFTLIEMIIVVAIFGLIMITVLSLLDPVKKVYSNAYNEADSQAISENFRRYVGDQIQYADRMWVYTDMTLNSVDNEVADFRKHYYFVPEANAHSTVPGGTDGLKERIYPYDGFKDHDVVYVLRIENYNGDLSAFTGTLPVQGSMLGSATLMTYTNGALTDTKVWSSNTDYYEDYAMDITLQTVVEVDDGLGGKERKFIDLNEAMDGAVSANNFAMGIKMYRKNPVRGDLTNATLSDTFTNRTITFKLKNLVQSTGTFSMEELVFTDKTNFPKYDVKRIEWFDNNSSHATAEPDSSASRDIYFIYTKVPVIESLS